MASSMRRNRIVEYSTMIRKLGVSLSKVVSGTKLLCVGLLGLDGLMWGWGRGNRPPPRRPRGPAAATA